MQITRASLASVAVALSFLLGCGQPSVADRLKAAQVAMDKGDLATALVELKSGLQIDPSSGELRFRLGSVLLASGDSNNAVIELRKGFDQGYKNDSSTARLASAMVASGKFKEVTEAYASATLTEGAARAEMGSAVAAAWLGQRLFAKARKSAEDVLRDAPEYGPALLVQARLAAVDGKFDDALALADRAAKGPAAGDAHMLRAHLLSDGKNDRQRAISAYEQAAHYPSAAFGARLGLIQMHLAGRDLAKAKSELALLQKSHPKHLNTVYFAAVIAFLDGKFDQAEALTDALLKQVPSHPQILLLSGAVHLKRGSLVAAESKLGRVVQTVEKAPIARKLLADTYLRGGQPDKALAVLAPLMVESGDGDVLVLIAQAHLQQGQVEKAEAAFKSALALKPNDVQLRTSLAITDLAKGKPEAAFSALQQLAAQDAGQTADMALISAHLRRREFDQALAAIDRLHGKDSKSALPSHLRGVALIGKGDTTGARKAFESALAADQSYMASTLMLVSLDTKARNFDAARSRLESVLKQSPKSLAARMALVEVLNASGASSEQILSVIDEALRAHPTEPAPHLAKLAFLNKSRSVKDAAAHAQAAIVSVPNDLQVLDAGGMALAAAGEFQQALSTFNRMAGLAPTSAAPYIRLYDLHVRNGKITEAAAFLRRALDVAPDSADAHKRLLDAAVKRKEFSEALSAARTVQRRLPDSPAGFALEGSVEAARKSWPAAFAAYEQALKRRGSVGLIHRQYYAAMVASGQQARAQQFAADWMKQNPSDIVLRTYLGAEAISHGRLAVAEGLFREIVHIDPSNVAALNNLAWLLAERKDAHAIEFADRALKLAPELPEVQDTSAKVYEASGDLKAALAAQQRAIDRGGERPMYRFAMARLLAKTGDKQAALRQLDQLAAAGVSAPSRAQIAAERARIQAN